MLKPKEGDLIEAMRYVYNHYDKATEYSYGIVNSLREYYNWDRLTAEAFGALEHRLK
jgi:hypothetical protein